MHSSKKMTIPAHAVWLVALSPVFIKGMDFFYDIKTNQVPKLEQNITQNPSLINLYDEAHMTPLHYAAQFGYKKISSALVIAGAKINALNHKGQTPLHIAHPKVLPILLKQGALINLQDTEGNTPLHCAIARYCLDAARLLIGAKANTMLKNKKNETPLAMAKNCGNDYTVAQLIADPTQLNFWQAVSCNDLTRVQKLIAKNHKQIFNKDMYGATALHYSAAYGFKTLITELLADGIDPNSEDNEGQTPLHYAAENNQAKATKILLDNEAISTKDRSGFTPLDLAHKNYFIKVAKLLATPKVGQ